MRCVRHIWRNGPLPESRLSKVCGNAWEAVKACAAEYDGGLSFTWLEDARSDAHGRSKRASVAGVASFNARSTDVQHKFNGRSTDVLSISKSSSTSESTSQERKERAHELTWPEWAGPNTLKAWEEFKSYRWAEHKVKYRSTDTEQRAVNILAKYFPSGQECVSALHYTTGKGWKFPVDPAEHKYPKAEGAVVSTGWNPRM